MIDISDLRILLRLFSYNPNKKLLSRSPLPFSRVSWMGLLKCEKPFQIGPLPS